MKTVILAGGKGTRLAEETGVRPKPMVEIGDRPLLWHLMNIYRAAGFNEFHIALGYKGEVAKQYFLNATAFASDLTIDLKTGEVNIQDGDRTDWTVHLHDTGLETMTGGRIKRLASYLKGESFFLTYGDGLIDLDMKKLLEFHRSHGKLCTVTAVHIPSRFGVFDIETESGRVNSFREKSQTDGSWINGGFFVCEPGVLETIDDDSSVWERTPLERLADRGELMAYRHEGFWYAMDSLREKQELERMWNSGQAAWKIW